MKMKKLLRLIASVSPKTHTHIIFFQKMGKILNLSNPQTFNEKIHWLKFNEYPDKDIYTVCADKYLVRQHIKNKGLENTLSHLIGVYDSFEDIDFKKLPNKFALKCNHGSGYNIIVHNKKHFNHSLAKKKLDKWLLTDFSLSSSEPHYKQIPRKIICEEFIEDKMDECPNDYKFYCFNGVPKFLILCISCKDSNTKFYYFDLSWNLMPYNNESIKAIENNTTIEKPKAFNEMISYAKKIADDFKFVRVDFYYVKEKIVFGELTFTPAAGLNTDRFAEIDLEMGKMLELN